MAEKVIIETTLNNQQPVAQVKNLKTQLRELKQEQAQAAMAFGENSKQVTEVSKKIAELADLQEDLNRKSTAYKSDPFDKAIFTLNGLAAGFQAAAGAAAVFGAESDDVQKSLLKVQGAVALSQGIMDITDMAKAYGLFSKATISSVVASLGTLRGALIATGIGAAAVAVGLLIANWEKVVKIVREFIGLGPTQAEILEQQTKELEKQNAIIEARSKTQDLYIRSLTGRNREIAQLTKQHTDEILKLQQEYQEAEIKIQQDEILSTDEKYEKLRELEKNFKNDMKAFGDAMHVEQTEQRKKFDEDDKAAAKKRTEDRLAAEEEQLLRLAEWRKEANERVAKEREAENEAEAARNKKAGGNNKDEIFKTLGLPTEKETAEAMASYTSFLEQKRDKERATDEAIYQYKAQIAQDTINIGASIASALGASDGVSKAFALGQIAYDTATALTKALSVSQSPSPDNVATGGLAGIAKYTSIAAMIAINVGKAISIVNSKKPTMSAIGGGFNVPNVNIPRIPIQGTQVEGAGDRTAGNSMRVYVVESDIRNTQNRIDVIESNSTIG